MLDRAKNVDKARALSVCTALRTHPLQVAAWIHEGGLECTREPGVLFLESEGGLAFVSELGVIMPHLTRSESLNELAERIGPVAARVVVGPKWATGTFWQDLERRGSRARIVRDQVGYAVSRTTFRELSAGIPHIQLRAAGPEDLDAVVAASAAMSVEESKDDPGRRNPSLFRARISERLKKGRDFILVDKGRLLFKVNVAAVSPYGGHIEGVYTCPSVRGRGIGRAGMAWATRWILERGWVATLLVNEDNYRARRLYEDLGYHATYESRTILAH